MDKKEAIWRIQDHQRIHSKKEPFTPKLDEAFSMAIEALKNEQNLKYEIEDLKNKVKKLEIEKENLEIRIMWMS